MESVRLSDVKKWEGVGKTKRGKLDGGEKRRIASNILGVAKIKHKQKLKCVHETEYY